jgi:hypothetical protein
MASGFIFLLIWGFAVWRLSAVVGFVEKRVIAVWIAAVKVARNCWV